MGQGIVYCNSCGLQILESEFRRGRAATVTGKSYCKNCMKAALERSAAETLSGPESATTKTTSIGRKIVPGGGERSHREESPTRVPGGTRRITKVSEPGFLPADPKARILFIVVGVLLVLAVVVILVLMSRR